MKTVTNIKIFISSSTEMKDDIREIELFISRKNKLSISQNVFFELIQWEDFPVNFSPHKSIQEIFNETIKDCDVFILLVNSSLGSFAYEEFKIAMESLKKESKPFVYVIFKNSPIALTAINPSQLERIMSFRENLKKMGHNPLYYENIESLKMLLSKQLDKITSQIIDSQKGENKSNKKEISIFISYNHKDSEKAINIKKLLEKSGFSVIIDSENLYPGFDIESFIKDSILNTNVTLSIVSKNSLLSSWVGMESVESFNKESKDNQKFIPIIMEKSFFERKFTGEALESIDEEITEIIEILKTRLEKKTGFADLYGEFKRYLLLRNNIDEIVRRLRESLSIDISEKNYDLGMQKVINYLTDLNENYKNKKN